MEIVKRLLFYKADDLRLTVRSAGVTPLLGGVFARVMTAPFRTLMPQNGGWAPLHAACREGVLEMVKALLDLGWSVKCLNLPTVRAEAGLLLFVAMLMTRVCSIMCFTWYNFLGTDRRVETGQDGPLFMSLLKSEIWMLPKNFLSVELM